MRLSERDPSEHLGELIGVRALGDAVVGRRIVEFFEKQGPLAFAAVHRPREQNVRAVVERAAVAEAAFARVEGAK